MKKVNEAEELRMRRNNQFVELDGQLQKRINTLLTDLDGNSPFREK